MRGMSIRQVMSTTTTVGTVIGFSRLIETPESEATRLSVALQCVLRQGVPTLPLDEENNSAPYIPEPFEVAGVDEGQLFDTLFDSMLKRKAGVMWKPQVKSWVLNGAVNIHRLSSSLYDGSYASRIPLSIQIYYPKKRVVKAIPFRDRIWQGYLNDHYVYPYMTRSFIWGNMASQYGKGTDKARELLRKYLWKHYTHYGTEGYVLQIDIHQYYTTIPRDKAFALFQKRLPPNLYRHVEEILNVQYSDSFYAGSQLVQILGIAYLDGLDHFIKEKLRIRYYIRYQDDFLLIHHDRKVLENALCKIKEQLAELGLTLNCKKTFIREITAPILFLGFLYSLQKDGKIYMRVNPKRLKEIRRRLKRYPPSFPSYMGFLSKGKSGQLIKRLEKELQKYAET